MSVVRKLYALLLCSLIAIAWARPETIQQHYHAIPVIGGYQTVFKDTKGQVVRKLGHFKQGITLDKHQLDDYNQTANLHAALETAMARFCKNHPLLEWNISRETAKLVIIEEAGQFKPAIEVSFYARAQDSRPIYLSAYLAPTGSYKPYLIWDNIAMRFDGSSTRP